MKLRAVVGSLLISAAVAGAAVMPASGQAGEVGIQAEEGQVCNILSYWIAAEVWSTSSGGSTLYYVFSGDGFRIVSYAANNMYYGHGNGKANGYLNRDAINQSSCHW